MKNFTSVEEMKAWFINRNLSDDVCYIKSFTQQIIISSIAAKPFNIYDGEFLDTSLILSEIREIVAIDKEIIESCTNGFSYELWSLDTPQILYWNKRLLQVKDQIFILQELHPLANLNVRSIIGQINVKRNWRLKNVKERFTEKEIAIMYLSIHGMSTKQVAEILFISPGTVKAHIWNKIRPKMCNLGYDAQTKDLVVETAGLMGMGDIVPPLLVSKINPTTKLIKSYEHDVFSFKRSSEFDLRC